MTVVCDEMFEVGSLAEGGFAPWWSSALAQNLSEVLLWASVVTCGDLRRAAALHLRCRSASASPTCSNVASETIRVMNVLIFHVCLHQYGRVTHFPEDHSEYSLIEVAFCSNACSVDR